MYVLGILTGMLGAWFWLAFASPHARQENNDPNSVEVQCHFCGRMYRTIRTNLRVTNRCGNC